MPEAGGSQVLGQPEHCTKLSKTTTILYLKELIFSKIFITHTLCPIMAETLKQCLAVLRKRYKCPILFKINYLCH